MQRLDFGFALSCLPGSASCKRAFPGAASACFGSLDLCAFIPSPGSQ